MIKLFHPYYLFQKLAELLVRISSRLHLYLKINSQKYKNIGNIFNDVQKKLNVSLNQE